MVLQDEPKRAERTDSEPRGRGQPLVDDLVLETKPEPTPPPATIQRAPSLFPPSELEEQPEEPIEIDVEVGERRPPRSPLARMVESAPTSDLMPVVMERGSERHLVQLPATIELLATRGKQDPAVLLEVSPASVFLKTELRLPRGARLLCSFIAPHQRRDIPGRVSERASGGVTMNLVDEVRSRAFMIAFIDDLRAEGPGGVEVQIREVEEDTGDVPAKSDNESLNVGWRRVERKFDDDTVHQEFIQLCLRMQRLDFALQCYRGARSARPEDQRSTEYLKQVGTILSFYAFRKTQLEEKQGSLLALPSLGRTSLYLMILVGLAIAFLYLRSRS